MLKYSGIAILCISTVALTVAHINIEKRLNPYKQHLEKWTYEGQNWAMFKLRPKSRYETFKQAFTHFFVHNGRTIVELGTSRSFTHGGHPGCNKDDRKYWMPQAPENWDWGAGF